MIDIDELVKLRKACEKVERTATKRIEAAITPILQEFETEAMARVPYDTGSLMQSFGIKIKKYGRGTAIFGIAGPQITDGEFETPKGKRVPWRYFHLVTGGTKERQTRKGYNRGSVQANPFYDRLKEKYRKLINDKIQETFKEIESEIQ